MIPPEKKPFGEVPQIESTTLFAGAVRLHIVHDGQLYVLRITRDNKLLLTK